MILLISLTNLVTRLTIHNSVKFVKRFTGKDKIPGKILEAANKGSASQSCRALVPYHPPVNNSPATSASNPANTNTSSNPSAQSTSQLPEVLRINTAANRPLITKQEQISERTEQKKEASSDIKNDFLLNPQSPQDIQKCKKIQDELSDKLSEIAKKPLDLSESNLQVDASVVAKQPVLNVFLDDKQSLFPASLKEIATMIDLSPSWKKFAFSLVLKDISMNEIESKINQIIITENTGHGQMNNRIKGMRLQENTKNVLQSLRGIRRDEIKTQSKELLEQIKKSLKGCTTIDELNNKNIIQDITSYIQNRVNEKDLILIEDETNLYKLLKIFDQQYNNQENQKIRPLDKSHKKLFKYSIEEALQKEDISFVEKQIREICLKPYYKNMESISNIESSIMLLKNALVIISNDNHTVNTKDLLLLCQKFALITVERGVFKFDQILYDMLKNNPEEFGVKISHINLTCDEIFLSLWNNTFIIAKDRETLPLLNSIPKTGDIIHEAILIPINDRDIESYVKMALFTSSKENTLLLSDNQTFNTNLEEQSKGQYLRFLSTGIIVKKINMQINEDAKKFITDSVIKQKIINEIQTKTLWQEKIVIQEPYQIDHNNLNKILTYYLKNEIKILEANVMVKQNLLSHIKENKKLSWKKHDENIIKAYEKALLDEEVKFLLFVIKLFDKKMKQDAKHEQREKINAIMLKQEKKENER